MKKSIFFLFFAFTVTALKAQTSYNFSRFGVGFGISSTHAYTNVPSLDNSVAQSYSLTYYYSPYVPLTAEVQLGKLTGGGVTQDPYGRQFLNKYQAFILHGDLQFGQIIDYEDDITLGLLKNFYGGTGFGFIKNNLTVQRTSPYDSGYVFPGTDNSVNIMVPLRIGYEFKFFNSFGEPFIRLNAGYIHNFVFGGGLDGYNDPAKNFKNNGTNQYRQIFIGIKIDFGGSTAYNKAL